MASKTRNRTRKTPTTDNATTVPETTVDSTITADQSTIEAATIPAKDETKGVKGMSKLAIYRSHYVRATHNGDPLAEALDGKDLPTVARVGAAVLGVTADELIAKYAHLNVGQRRMNIGNRVRAAVRKDPMLMAIVTRTLGQ